MDGNSVWQRSDGNFQRFINVRQFGAPDWQAPNQTAMWDWDWDRLIWLENLCRSVQHMDRNTVKFTDTTNKLTPSKSATYSADIKDPHFWVKDGQSLFPATYIRFKPLFHHWNPKISCFTSWWRCTVYIYIPGSLGQHFILYIFICINMSLAQIPFSSSWLHPPGFEHTHWKSPLRFVWNWGPKIPRLIIIVPCIWRFFGYP